MDYKKWPLDRWLTMFKEIYGDHNKGLTDEMIWLHIVEEAGELAEDLRKQHIKPRNDDKGKLTGILVNLPDTFAWFSAFTIRYGSLEEITWNKFPNVCPYCMANMDCVCIREKPSMSKKEQERSLELHRTNKENYPRTLYNWQEMFGRIYGKVNKIQSIEQIGFHLMEEVGEVAKAIRLRDETKLRKELADVLAWVIGVTIKCEDLTGESYRLDDLVWARYPNQCPHCESKPCSEEIYKAKKSWR